MKIETYKDIISIDAELATLFLRPDEAVNWIYAVENGIKEWITNKNSKQYWDVVRFVSEKRGILGKYKKDGKTIRLTRKDFARVLLKFCPGAFDKDESVSTLESSMCKYKFATVLKKLDEQLSGHVARQHVKAIEDLLDSKPIIALPEKESTPTLEDLMVTYLRQNVENDENKIPHSKVCIRPQYEGISPAISVETYYSESLLKKHEPSHIDTYEFIDGVLEEKKLNELTGQYLGKNVKLFIVSSAGLLPKVRELAKERHIGYILIDQDAHMNSVDYKLARMTGNQKEMHYLKVLEGKLPMTTPLLIMDGEVVTSSLEDVLRDNDVIVKEKRLTNIRYLPYDDIEKQANDIIKEDIEKKIQKIEDYKDLNPRYFTSYIDPFHHTTSRGLKYKREDFEEDSLLGYLDIASNQLVLNSDLLGDYERYRFTMAHELGHYILHVPFFREQGIDSIEESEETLALNKNDSFRLEYQANAFASCFLMPKKLVHKVYDSIIESCKSDDDVVYKMAKILVVSKQAMKIRLDTLGLLKKA